MASNLTEQFDNVIGELLVKHAGGFLGESAESIRSAIKLTVPAVIAAMYSKCQEPGGADKLINILADNQLDGSLTAKADTYLMGNIETEKLMYTGSVLSRHLFEDKLAAVVDAISSGSGMSTSSATSMVKMIVPFLSDMIARYKAEHGVYADGIRQYLSTQFSSAGGSLTGQVKNALGVTSIPEVPKERVSGNESGSDLHRKNWMPWVILAITALGAFYFVRKGCAPTNEEMQMTTTVDTVNVSPKDKAVNRVSFTFANGKTIHASPKSFTAQIAGFLTGNETGEKCFQFDKVYFENNSFKLAFGSEKQLQELADLIIASPEGKIRIEAHTDDEGDEGKNKNISRERAQTIKDWLTEHEVPGNRIDVKGWGEEKPIASNEDAFGRSKNRRMEVCVTKK